MAEFNKGDVVYHKATGKRCVVTGLANDGRLSVTTENDQYRYYHEEELISEEEWNKG